MSLKASSIAYRAKTTGPICKLVLIALADYADESGCVTVELEELAAFAMATPRGVEQALADLVATGHLTLQATDNGKRIATIVGGAL
jgi:hypothetical protein